MRTIAVLVVLPLALLASPSFGGEAEDRLLCADSSRHIDDRFAACERLAEAGDAAANRTMASSTLLPRANVLLLKEQFEAAIVEYSAAIILDSGDARFYRGRGEASLFIKRYLDAADDLERVVQLGEATFWDYLRLGTAYEELNDPASALVQFDAAIRLRPDSGYAFALRGDVHDDLGQTEKAVTDYSTAIETILSAHLYSKRAWMYRDLDDYDALLRDLHVAYLLNPNLLRLHWTAGYETLWPEFVEEHWPPLTVPAVPGPFQWEPPEGGLRIDYIRIENEDRPVDPMMAAIDDITAWFVYRDRPLPIESTVYEYKIGATSARQTKVVVTDVYEQSPQRERIFLRLLYGALPTSQSFGPLPALKRDYGDALREEIWPAAAGDRLEGNGILFVTCSETPNPYKIMVGCLDGVAESTIGQFTWNLALVGWENVVTPAGRRLTARFAYEEAASMTVRGDTRSTETSVDWWFDPEIDWWIRRERLERHAGSADGTIEVLEAIEISRPD